MLITFYKFYTTVINCCREDNPDREIPDYGTKEVTWNFENYNLPNGFKSNR